MDVNVREVLFSSRTVYRPMIMESADVHTWAMGDKTFELNLVGK